MQLKAFDPESIRKKKYFEAELRKVKPFERDKRRQELLAEMDNENLQKLADAFGGKLID